MQLCATITGFFVKGAIRNETLTEWRFSGCLLLRCFNWTFLCCLFGRKLSSSGCLCVDLLLHNSCEKQPCLTHKYTHIRNASMTLSRLGAAPPNKKKKTKRERERENHICTLSHRIKKYSHEIVPCLFNKLPTGFVLFSTQLCCAQSCSVCVLLSYPCKAQVFVIQVMKTI